MSSDAEAKKIVDICIEATCGWYGMSVLSTRRIEQSTGSIVVVEMDARPRAQVAKRLLKKRGYQGTTVVGDDLYVPVPALVDSTDVIRG